MPHTPRRSTARRRVLAAVCIVALSPAAPAFAGQASCWIDKGALVASASFGDIAGDFLIDLSSPVSQLHNTRAELAGLEALVVRRDLTIAGKRIAGVDMAVADLDGRTKAFDTSINGVIGADVLGRYTVDIEASPCRIRLSTAKARRFRGGVRLPVKLVDGQPLVGATISDGVRVRTGLFAIDTGRWAARVTNAQLSRTPTADPDQPLQPIRLRALELGGHLFEQAPAVIDTGGDGQSAGSIGMAVLSSWRLRLDMRDGWLDLEAR